MSIIYEALKKVEDKKKEDLDFSVLSKELGKPNEKKTKPSISNSNKLKAFLILGAVVLVLSFLIFWITNYKEKHISVFTKRIPRKAVPKSNTFRELNLEGVMYDEQDPFAIIDGRVVRKNDRVDNWIVDEIKKNQAVLVDPKTNTKITLSLPF